MWDWESESRELGISTRPSDTLNIGVEITDRVCEKGFGNKTAVLCRGKDGRETRLTYVYLSKESTLFASYLKGLGVSKGDRVFLCLDRMPELYISIIGIFKAGAILGPVFSSFGQEALKDRLEDSEASTIIIQSFMLEKVLEIRYKLPKLKNIIIIKDNNADSINKDGVVDFDDYKKINNNNCIVKTYSNDPAIIHYTSGTTGKPKGALHAHSALLAHFATSRHVLGFNKEDIYLCTADPAWVTGMTYGIIGPFSNAVTQISIEGNLRPQTIFEAIQKYNVTVLYTAPTLLRMMMQEKEETIKAYNFSSLRIIASVGEALNPEIIKWAQKYIGIPVYDTWFQTETGSIMIANTFGVDIKPGSMGKTVTPVSAAILDDNFETLTRGNIGHLALKPDWPSMFRDYWGRKDIYEGKFKNGWYLTGDTARMDEEGYFWFIGRDDDVINTAGHLVSPFEVESALIEHPLVSEAAAIGIPDNMLGEKIKAFIVLKPGRESSGRIKVELRSHVRNQVSPFAVPQEIEVVDAIPRTRSGKLMRRLLRARELGLPEIDTSTLEEK